MRGGGRDIYVDSCVPWRAGGTVEVGQGKELRWLVALVAWPVVAFCCIQGHSISFYCLNDALERDSGPAVSEC